MIEAVLPDGVVAFETREELLEVELFPEEEAAVGKAVEKRRREFLTGRACARRALEQIGFGTPAVPAGERGQPLWPEGVVGSITHCSGYRACAVSRAGAVASLGIDAEVHDVLPEGVLDAVSSPRERARIAGGASATCMDRVLFSAKESVYKAWFPLTGRWLGFEDVDMSFDMERASFSARLLVPGPVVAGRQLTEIRGRWHAAADVVLTASVVEGQPAGALG